MLQGTYTSSSNSTNTKNTKDEGCFDCGAKDHGDQIQVVPNVAGAIEGGRVSARAVVEDHLLRVQLVPQALVVFRPGNKPNVNVSEANVVDLLSPHPPVQFREVSFAEKSEIQEINVAESLAVALTTSATRPSDQLPLDKVYQAAVD